MKKLFRLLGTLSLFALPALALAQNSAGDLSGLGQTNAFSILGVISSIFGVLIPILVTFAVIYIIVGVIQYATASDDEKQTTARKRIISGIIALFVIVSIWGLVAILNNTFNVGQNGTNFGACQPVYNPATNPPTWTLPAGC
jgi:hypothetical protein